MRKALPWVLLGAAVLAGPVAAAHAWRQAGIAAVQAKVAAAAEREQFVRDSFIDVHQRALAVHRQADSLREAQLAAARERSRQDSIAAAAATADVRIAQIALAGARTQGHRLAIAG